MQLQAGLSNQTAFLAPVRRHLSTPANPMAEDIRTRRSALLDRLERASQSSQDDEELPHDVPPISENRREQTLSRPDGEPQAAPDAMVLQLLQTDPLNFELAHAVDAMRELIVDPDGAAAEQNQPVVPLNQIGQFQAQVVLDVPQIVPWGFAYSVSVQMCL